MRALKSGQEKITRYEKKEPFHYVQVDVKFLLFNDNGHRVKPDQHTTIDDCTCVRGLKIYEHHNQARSIEFINYVVEKFPSRIKTIRTDNSHEFQTKFQWHISDLGIFYMYIKPTTPRHNCKVEW